MPWAAPDYGEPQALAWCRRELGAGETPFVILDPRRSIVGSCGIDHRTT